MSVEVIKLRASEIASYAGMNPYNSVEKAVQNLLGPRFKTNLEKELFYSSKEELSQVAQKLGLSKDEKKEVILKTMQEKMAPVTSEKLKDEESKKRTSQLSKELGLAKKIKEAVEGDVRMRRGNLLEKKELNKMQSRRGTNIVNRNSCFYTTTIELGEYESINYTAVVTGKIDGYEEETGKLIESKHRRSRLFNEVPIYEKVQCEIYMRMIGVNECVHCENYNEKSNETVIQKDELFWNQILENLKTLFLPLYCETKKLVNK